MLTILIVEDEKAISDLIRFTLSDEGYNCECAFDGEEAANLIESKRYDLVLLDVMLPKIDGFELFEYIKEFNVPVIFLTAKSDVEDRIKGLRLGAEDYICKPFNIGELVARVETVLRRFEKKDLEFDIGDVHVDISSRVVTKGKNYINLTAKEFDTLLVLYRNRNIALERSQIYYEVWGEDYMGDSRTVDLHVQRIRKKLGLDNYIVSVYKVGYRLEVDA